MMDDGEVDFSNQEVFSGSNLGDLPYGCSMDSFFLDDILTDAHACTHTHTCNPPGPDLSHTHTCLHVHTKIVSGSNDDKVSGDDDTSESSDKKKRPLGNREAVRKYREKKKARTASLEDEVVRLRAMNQQLVKRLQGQAVLEAEVARLKCLLVDIRGRIEGEIGSFPYQKPAHMGTPNLPGAYVVNPCNVQCDDQVYCHRPGLQGKSVESASLHGQACEFETQQCLASQDAGLKEFSGCGVGNGGAPEVNSSGANRRRGRRHAANAS